MSNNDIKTNRSGSSSGSTITPSAFERQARGGGAESERADKQRKPDPLSFLEKDSPAVTEEHIRRVIAESGGDWSPRSASSSLSADSNSRRSVAETDSTTPDHSVNGDIQSTTFKQRSPSPSEGSVDVRRTSRARSGPSRQQRATSQTKGDDPAYRYGTPEMARGSAKHPHFPPSELQPRLSARGHGHTKHLPRAEKLPMSGYELLSAKLSNSSTRSRRRPGSTKELPTEKGEPRIKPIYRRFEALNHRLLLHLQDELSELEEQLHRLDTADTQTRRLQNCILPASRRAEFMAGGELQWHKTDLLGKIGFKLGQYNHVLSSFSETQSLPPASMSDVEDYRTYLATHNPIAEIETRFLDPAEDLVCLAPHRSPTSSYSDSSSLSSQYFPHSDDALTPMPRKMSFGRPSPGASGGLSSPRLGTSILNKKGLYGRREGQLTNGEESQLGLVACLAAVAVVGPVVAFPVVTDFLGRMAVVLVAGLAVAALRQKVTDTRVGVGGQSVKSEDVLPVVGVYAVVMVIIAAVL
ncbi:hypothetical protein B0H63DRAFT_393730 [Podospora didyma]|uniref:DUF6594 domain-containing protein n=1 Tax=Podospora didyma TaxID=330526 RepID=A0AAE0NNM3_9PEZI|nr:hypothetical protein B0H63DRAFT_393730 [Podospora didyma]